MYPIFYGFFIEHGYAGYTGYTKKYKKFYNNAIEEVYKGRCIQYNRL